jgi:hypothetical protein
MAKNKSKADGNQVNKSQAIREMLQQHPEAKAKEIAALLAQRKIDVKPSTIYVVKGKLAQLKHHKARKAERLTNASQKTGSADPIALIVKVKKLAKEAGGMVNLQRLVTVLAD